MKGKKRFYCSTCKEFLARNEVVSDGDVVPRYYCKRCGQPVMQTAYIWEDLLTAAVEQIVKSGAESKFY